MFSAHSRFAFYVQNYEALNRLALDCGFSQTGELDPKTIVLYPEVRGQCEANRCRAYGKNRVCPPACGTLEECEVCQANNIKYYYGPGTLTHVGCVLVE